MKFNDYQAQIAAFDLFTKEGLPSASDLGFINKVLGLVGEAGEVAEKFKKLIRDKDGVITEADKDEIIKELGDVMWYLATIARYLDVELEQVAAGNLDKIASRKARGVQKGSGDNR